MDLFLSADEYIPMDSQCRDLALQSDYLTAGDIGYVLRTEAIKRILSGSLWPTIAFPIYFMGVRFGEA